jgi:hypothetical protein
MGSIPEDREGALAVNCGNVGPFVPVGPLVGRRAIAEAYARQPPSDTVLLLGRPRVEGDTVESDYAWAGEGTRAGRMILTTNGEMIERLVVTFE